MPAGWRRLPAFLLASGSAGAALWAIGGLLATLCSYRLLELLLDSTPSSMPVVEMAGFASFVIAYTFSGLLVHRSFLPRLKRGLTWVVVGLLVAAGSLIPLIVAFLVDPERVGSRGDAGAWMALNPFAASEGLLGPMGLVVGMVWALAVAVPASRWARAQWRAFRAPADLVAEAPAESPGEEG